MALAILGAAAGGCGGQVAVASPIDRGPAAGRCGPVSETLVPGCGAWLGIWPRTRADGTVTGDLAGNLASLEDRLGRRFDVVSRYYGWGKLPPDDTDLAWRDSGHLLLIDLRARDFATGRYASWRDIADGRHDPYLVALAARFKAFGGKVFFSFNQEPEQELERGTAIAGSAGDFAAAYRHLHDVFDRAGADNVVWVWWIMGYLGHTTWYPELYPGDRYVDWLSYDPYDFNRCRGTAFETPRQSVAPFLDWLAASGIGAGKPVMLSEFGSHGTDRGDWYRGFGEVVKTLPRIKAVVSFNSNPGGCDTRVTASADNWAGLSSLARDPYFNQPLPPTK